MARNKKQFPYVGGGASRESLGIRERVLAIPSYSERVGRSKRESLLGVYLDMKERDYQVIGLLFLTVPKSYENIQQNGSNDRLLSPASIRS